MNATSHLSNSIRKAMPLLSTGKTAAGAGGGENTNNYPVSLQIDNTQTMAGETTTGGARNNIANKAGAGAAGLSTTQNDLSSILDSATAHHHHIVPGTSSNYSSTDIVLFPQPLCPKAAGTANSTTGEDDYSCR